MLAAGYLLWLYQRTAFGEPSEEFANEPIEDMNKWEMMAWAPFLLGIVVLGVYPNLLFSLSDDVVTGIANSVSVAVGAGN